MVQSWQTMHPGHPEHNLWGIAPLVMPEMPEAWQHAVNHWLDVALAFSGLSLGLGYGVLVLALPLLLLPTAFPELSRPRDALWSLLLAALAPLLLLNRLPVFSSAGLGELIATLLMARLAAEVGQGRWESLTPDQKEALRHLPRWRRAGADLVAAVVQAAKATWSAIVQAGKAVRGGDQDGDDQGGGTSPGVPHVPPAMEAGPGPAADNAPDAEPPQPVDGGDGGQEAEAVQASVEDAATGESGAAAPEQGRRARTGLVAAVVQAGKAAWGKLSGQKGPVEQRQQRWSAQKPARKEWVRPDPADGAQGDQDAATGSGEDATPEQGRPDKPTADEPVMAVVVDDTPEEPSAPEPVEEPQQAQPVDGDDPGDGKAADAVPGDVTPETVESSVEPPELETQPSEVVVADAVGPEPEPKESAAEEPSTPEPVEEPQQAQPVDGDDPGDGKAADAVSEVVEGSVEPAELEAQPSEGSVADAVGPGGPEPTESVAEEPSAPELVEEPQQAQPVDGDDLGDGKAADAVSEVVEGPVEPLELEAQPSEGVVADAVGPGPEPSESVAEEGAPEPVEEPQQAQPPGGLDNPKTNPADTPLQDGDNSTPVDVVPEGDPGNLAAAGEGGEGFVAAKAEADGATQETTDASGAEAEPAQPVGHGSTQPAQDGDVVVSSFDEVDGKLRDANRQD